jgi:5'-3' exonuclease
MTTLLVDGHHMLHRVAFIRELQELTTSKGRHIGPVFGFLRVLRATLERFKASSCIVAWDAPGGSTYRKELYPAYKANRKEGEKPEALAHINEQKLDIQKLLPFLNVKQICCKGLEGDDTLCLLIRSIPEHEDVVVVTEDKDLLQLIDYCNVSVYRPISDQLIDEDNFESVVGVPPSLFALHKAVVGDKSDNISGIHGVGPKTINKLLTEAYYSEDADCWDADCDPLILKETCDDHKTKTGRKVYDEWETVKRNLKLVDLWANRNTLREFKRAKAVIAAEGGVGATDVEVIQALGRYEFNSLAGVKFGQWVLPFRRLQ